MEQQTTQQYYSREREKFERNGASGSPEWMKQLRETAFESFSRQGFPGVEMEEWRFTNVSPIAKEQFAHAAKNAVSLSPADIDAYRITAGEHRFTFVNGYFSEHLSTAALPKGLNAFSIGKADQAQQEIVREHMARRADIGKNAFAALNTAFVADGLFLQFTGDAAVEEPIHILHLSTSDGGNKPAASYPRVIIASETGSSATVVETFASPGAQTYFTNAVTEMLLKPGSILQYTKIQNEDNAAYHMHTVSVEQQEGSVLNMFSLALGGAISRSDISVILEGEKADCNLNGLYIADENRLTDHHTFIHHRFPECTSHELFKGILDGQARGVYSGKVYVDAIAQKTDSKQTNRNLMLSESATIDTKPQLEIFADDVKCTHGAAVGGLNEQIIFYLKSRGVGPETARAIVTVGFAAEVTEKIPHAATRQCVDALVVRQLRKKLGNLVPEIVHSGNPHEEE